ncbi:Fic family protein [Pelomonas sp. Root1217]|uniref:Fic family protein n=1 Tax=Pelomonas sp. Root1217 TaxID=1736430 RepID=UPI0012FB170C|nr:Fic family protein [Pelomonas sp. Root1217]
MDAELAALIAAAGITGAAPEALAAQLPGISRSTLNRRLAALLKTGVIRSQGAGRARRYLSAEPFGRDDIDAYFARPAQQRPLVRFRPELLGAEPGLPLDKAQRCTQVQALAQPIDARFLASFLIDLSWASSLLEGSTYSALDTAALIQYGQRNATKPTADAILVLNHKRAAEHLWLHRDLSVAQVHAMHTLLTDDHGLPEAGESDHFLPQAQRGRPREFEDVHLANSAYLPPFRPGTGFVAEALGQVVEQAKALHPVQAALYLMTRIPYLQAYANGNKRASRLAANAPLLASGLLPLSFADVDKADYIRGMAAFYELGSLHVIEQTFVRGYVRSVMRSSDLPASVRARGLDVAATAQALVEFINTGRRPTHKVAELYLG